MQVRIFKEAKRSNQAGLARTLRWRIEADTCPLRYRDSLMGWISGYDMVHQLSGRLLFDVAEDAVSFARAQGWDFSLDLSHLDEVEPHLYEDVFSAFRAEDEEHLFQEKLVG